MANRLALLVDAAGPYGMMSLPARVLDHFKFTDGLVCHSLLAMAEFVSSLLIFVMVVLLGEDGWVFNVSWSFALWQGAAFAYEVLMIAAGWMEGNRPAFTVAPGELRNLLYCLRSFLGCLMTAASMDWFYWVSRLLKQNGRQAVKIFVPAATDAAAGLE
ncbi:MAG TPA: hypothetical protein VGR96_11625, partial [Acidobacteriaceae bacterium]|nr:hypothetical protein [Acidobacteriaceae bacterium]